MSNVGFATVSIIPSAKGFQSALGKQIGPGVTASGKASGAAAGKGFKSSFLSSIKGIAAPIAAAVGIAAIGGFVKDAIGQASDLTEVGTALKTVFGNGVGAVEKFGATGAASLGMSKLAALKAAQSFGVYGKAAGLSGKENAKFSTGLASLGTDLSSFYNTSPEEAIAAIGSGLRGEAEPLRRFGVLLDDATLKSQAVKMGLIKTTKQALTPQQKVLAAHAVIMKQTGVAQGDFAKTSGGLANQQRILAARFDNLKGAIGTSFLPVATKVTAWASEFVQGIQDGTGAGGKLRDVVEKIGGALQSFGGFLKDNSQALGMIASMALGAFAAFKTLSFINTIRNAVIAFNLALAANPIGIVIVAIGALVGGLIYAYQNCQTFRDIVDRAWDVVKIGALTLAKVAIGALKGLVNFFLGMVSALVTGAAKAFGWVPGLGPKLQGAAKNVEGFKNRVNAELSKVEKNLELSLNTAKADAAASEFRRRWSAPIRVYFTTSGTLPGAGSILSPGIRRASGGRVFGAGTSTSDSIPARLSRGEYVIRAASAAKIGYDRLDELNARGFAQGGAVGTRSGSAGGGNVFHIYDVDGVLLGTMRDTARAEATQQARGISRGIR